MRASDSRGNYALLYELTLYFPRRHTATEDHLVAHHCCLGQPPPMKITLLFPCLASYFADAAQILIPRVPLRFAIPRLPDARSLARRDRRPCPALPDSGVTALLVVCAIRAALLDLPFNRCD